MSDLFQPGQHPDADQLNAFAENSLPLHEHQQTLAHLAICADCREIVYLSQQPDLGELAAPQAIRKPWFSGWNLLWPAAAALTCVVLFTVHLHTRISNNTDIVTTAAIQTAPPPLPIQQTLPAASPLSPPAASKQAPARGPNKQSIITPAVAAPDAVAETNTENVDETSQPQSATAFSPRDRSTKFLPHTGPVPATGSIHASAFRSTYASGGAVPKAIEDPLGGAAVQTHSANAEAINHSQQKAVTAAAPRGNQIDFSAKGTFNPQYQTAVSPPPASSAAAVAGTNQTVEVNRTMITVDATAADQSLMEKRLPALPSHLPALSIVSSAQLTLAIDTSGALFLSKDHGVSWQTVPAQWTGHALKLLLAPTSSQTAVKDTGSSLALHGSMIMGGPLTQPHPSVFELTIDTGAIWTSTDGQNWKQK